MILPSNDSLIKIYGECEHSILRFKKLSEAFKINFRLDKAEYFTAPGRSEIIGNHTDHNGGLIIASAIDMDTIGAACPNGTDIIRIISEGYDEISLDIKPLKHIFCGAPVNIANAPDEYAILTGTKALIAGVAEATLKYGFKISGFDAYVSSNVISAAGVSSSASFEMLICSIINYFFNDNAMNYTDYACIGSYAENTYWNKASGLMDQMACAAGGPILLDFSDKNNISCQKINLSFEKYGYSLIIVNTGKGHADLSREYSEIPSEMKEAASVLGAGQLCETNMESLLNNISNIKNDRAILRAMHFFEENSRVKKAVNAIENDDIEELLIQIKESGDSSWEYLQNCFCPQNFTEQKIPLTLALTRLFIQNISVSPEFNGVKNIRKGVCRVHGGGFAGVIMCIIPKEEKANYIKYISKYVGKENVYPLNIRTVGAVHLDI